MLHLTRYAGALAGAAAVLTVVPTAMAQVDDSELESLEARLGYAQAAFFYGDYVAVIDTLEPSFIPVPPDLSRETLVEVYTWLGVAAYYEGERELARASFANLLRADPDHQLDALVYPAEVIAFFDGVRAEATAGQVNVELEIDEDVTTIYLESRYREHPLWLSMAPLGYGFFAAGDDDTGLAYAAGELVFGLASVTSYAAVALHRDGEGWVDNEDVASDWRTVAHVGAVGFWSLVIANAVHGAVIHDSVSQVEYRTLPGPPDELSSRRPRRWTFQIVPILAP